MNTTQESGWRCSYDIQTNINQGGSNGIAFTMYLLSGWTLRFHKEKNGTAVVWNSSSDFLNVTEIPMTYSWMSDSYANGTQESGGSSDSEAAGSSGSLDSVVCALNTNSAAVSKLDDNAYKNDNVNIKLASVKRMCRKPNYFVKGSENRIVLSVYRLDCDIHDN